MRRRRWPLILLVTLVAGALYLGIAGGAARATAAAAGQARMLTASGDYAAAIRLNDAIGLRSGPLYLFDNGDVSAAPLNAQQVMLDWALALDRQGRYGQAIAVVDDVGNPALQRSAAGERARILLDAARSDAAHADYAGAISWLSELQAGSAPSSLLGQAGALLLRYQVAEAQALVVAGRGADAVTLLDQVSQESNGAAVLAAPVYPAALLGAGQEELFLDSYKEAAATLQRLQQRYPDSAQAAQARAMLAAPQPVTGTLVTHGGSPFSGEVRLSSNFVSEPGGYYMTSGPFYYANANATGTFRFGAVPVGGPYVLEVFSDDDWTTYVNPATGQPATPVNVTPLVPINLTFVELP